MSVRIILAVAVVAALMVAVFIGSEGPGPDAPPPFLDLTPSGFFPASRTTVASISEIVDVAGADVVAMCLKPPRNALAVLFVSSGTHGRWWPMIPTSGNPTSAKPDCQAVDLSEGAKDGWAVLAPSLGGPLSNQPSPSRLVYLIVLFPGSAGDVVLDTEIKRRGKWTILHTNMDRQGSKHWRSIIPSDFRIPGV